MGPWSIIGGGVEIAAGTVIGSHTVISGPSRIGKDNRIFHFCSIGEDPQDKKYKEDKNSCLEIGNGNTIREFCTINRGTEDGGGVTRVGDENWIMAYVHIAHDCVVGDNTVFANNASLAGHVTIDDHVILGGFTGVHQFCRIGQYSFSAISSIIVKDVPPYLMVSGNTASPAGLNREGLKRHNFSSDEINTLRKAYKVLYREGNTVNQALEQLEQIAGESEVVKPFVEFIRASDRGIIR
ncbi:MAG: acyl-ACP--UDP-N-acetylglucosamine O-acyltransferase [Proteobacteria bacterium]|nr:acyl-ACP--UDP-N-acetylglucosamine O-acyltransferase [Pseudomonadota bacterium]